MSFILDALKKSESERQRQSGPALFEVKVAPPRHRFAIWAIALGALLAINLVVVGWMLSRSSATRGAARVAAAEAPGTAAGSGTTAGAAAVSSAAPASAPVAAAAVPHSPAAAPGAGSPAAPGAIANAGAPAAALSAPAGSVQSAGAEAVARSDASPPPAAAGAGAANPDDLAPAVEPPKGSTVPDSGGSVVSEPESSLPSYQDAAAVPGANIPPLQLNLHVYSAKPDERFVFLNMVKLHEGEALPQGVRVDAITPDGVILSYHGTRFMLQHH
jgi:general secretion pathway protein B